MDHRSSERSLYDTLQRPECNRARGVLELMLSNTALTYETICERINKSKSWQYRDPATGKPCALPTITPQALSR
ncbi:MAG TPA: hypothetical protein VN743_01605, partial [Blastocatellia bacterium]|nr:hypothetical protein [Blastocatellia bacterium]